MPKASTWKVKERIPRILDAIQKREDLDEVAKEFRITRRALNYNMASYDFQSSLAQFLAMDMKRHYETIQEFLDSDDPEMKAEGMKEHGKMTRALFPKLIYKRSENENTTIVKLSDGSYSKLSLEEQDKLAEILLKLEDEKNKVPALKDDKPAFVESEYEVVESKGDEDDGDDTTPK